jgi:hypothetical protein
MVFPFFWFVVLPFIANKRKRPIKVLIRIEIFSGDAFGVQKLFELGSL